ncbi:MAG: DUF5666 domain-containing protein [Coriobacteriia bacterium]
MMKKALVVVGILVLLAGAFWGGTLYSNSSSPAGRGGFAADGTTPAGGGPMGNLTDDERAELESMTAQERQKFLQEKMGDAAPSGGMRGGAGSLQGEVIEIAGDTVTIETENGGSQTVYTDDETVIGYAQGVTALAAGSTVMVMAEPEADGVMTASGILVK